MNKMAKAKKILPLIDIEVLYTKAKADVQTYRDIVGELAYLIDAHPEVSRNFLCNTILDSYGVETDWFLDMQEHHKQSIIDAVNQHKPRKD